MGKREIRFRGRDVITGNWAYGFYYPSKGNAIIRDENDNECIVLASTVGQFTGLTDSKGVDVYEGDVMKNELNPQLFYWLISFSNGGFKLQNIGVDGYMEDHRPLYNSIATMRTVIGNVFESPELISK